MALLAVRAMSWAKTSKMPIERITMLLEEKRAKALLGHPVDRRYLESLAWRATVG